MTVHTPVYLDHHATTPLDPRVLQAMMPAFAEHFGNPSSASHAYGWAADTLVQSAREQVASLIGCEPGEIVFTSGATESDNLALLGLADRCPAPRHIVATVLEHDAVEATLVALEGRGWSVSRVGCGVDGTVDPDDVADALRDDTMLVTTIAAQNEIGTLQPWRDIAGLCRERGVPFHTDAAQAVGKVPIDMAADGIAMLSLSAHKFSGPKGVGALAVRRGRDGVRMAGLLHGGGQERGLRSGTLNVPGIVGLGEACRIAEAEMESDARRLRRLAASFYASVADEVDDVRLNGAATPRLPGSLNLSFPGLGSAELIRELPVLALSTGAACSSGQPGPSRALLAIGLDAAAAASSLRIAFGRGSTAEEAAFAAERLVDAVRRLRDGRGQTHEPPPA